MEVSVGQAARALGISDRRVRQLIAGGQLRARRVGTQWLVDGASLRAAPRRGRPMSTSVAWIFLTSPTPPVVHGDRWRERRTRLRDEPERALLLASWAAARAERLLFTAREPAGILTDPLVVPSGVSDPRSGLSAADVAEGYVTRRDVDEVRRRHLLRPAPGRPNVVLHVVDGLPDEPVPLLVLAADLAEHQGPRELARADALIAEVVQP